MKLQYTVPTKLTMMANLLSRREVDILDLDKVGIIIIHSIGQENIYFTSVHFGSEHFCKVN